MRQPPRTLTVIDRFDPDYDERNDRWMTPLPLVRSLGKFDLDPCGAPGHPTASTVWTPEDIGDGLALDWNGRVWLNPPYGRTMIDWVQRLAEHGTGTALLYARTDTVLFQDLVFPVATALLFIRRRVVFLSPDGRGAGNRGQGSAPSVLIAYGERDAQALAASDLNGRLCGFARNRTIPSNRQEKSHDVRGLLQRAPRPRVRGAR